MSLYSVWVGVGGVCGGYGGGLVFKILNVLHIFFWQGLIYGGLLTEFYGISSSYFLEHFSMASSDYTHVMIWGRIGRFFFLTVHSISLPINLQSEYTTINVYIQKEILR